MNCSKADLPQLSAPSQETIFGANDWHGLVPRARASVYFGRWALLRKGVPWLPLLEPEELVGFRGLGRGFCKGFVGFVRVFRRL